MTTEQIDERHFGFTKLNILVLADLHLDFHLNQGIDPLEQVPSEQLEGMTHVFLAGDLSNKGHKQWKQCLPWVIERVPNAKVYVCPGNHDYYGGKIDREDKLRDVAISCGVEYLQKSELMIGSHRFLVCTLWSDFKIYGDRADNMRNARSGMNDYRHITVAKTGFKRLTPNQTVQIHEDHRRWLEDKLSDGFEGKTIVVTHHAPHKKALLVETELGPCYASDMEDIILRYQPTQWIYGHTHTAKSFVVGTTEVRNVSVGYPGEGDPINDLDRYILDLDL